MTIYLDTSALIKLYVDEEGHQQVVDAVRSIEVVTVSVIGFAEARSGLSRLHREGILNDLDYRRTVNRLVQDWATFTHLNVYNLLAFRAGELADKHALRGYDAVHLATALRFAERYDDLQFLAFDNRLNAAAEAESLTLFASQG